MSEPACTTTVTSGGGLPSLATTGADPALSTVLVILALALLVTGGTILLLRYPRTRSTVLTALAAITVLGVLSPAPAAQASPTTPTCALFRVDAITAQNTDALLPGRSVDGLRYQVTNVTTAPIEVQVSTKATSDAASIAGHLETAITLNGTPQAVTPLTQVPTTPTVTLSPGGTITVAHTLTLTDTTDNTSQGQTVLYDSTIAASQP